MSLSPIIEEHVVNMTKDSNYYFAMSPEGDVGGLRYLDLILLNDNEPYHIPEDTDAVIAGTNAGGLTIFEACQIVANKVRVTLSPTILGAAGLGQYRIEFYATGHYDAGSRISSFNFNIFVKDAPYDVSKIINSSEYSELANLIQEARNVVMWRSGEGTPDVSLGKNGDFYIDLITSYLYKKDSDSWVYIMNLKGSSGHVYIRYSQYADGTGFHDSPQDGDHYIGVCSTTSAIAPTTKEDYDWMFMGRDTLPTVNVNWETGELIYEGGTLTLQIDSDGYLIWGEA